MRKIALFGEDPVLLAGIELGLQRFGLGSISFQKKNLRSDNFNAEGVDLAIVIIPALAESNGQALAVLKRIGIKALPLVAIGENLSFEALSSSGANLCAVLPITAEFQLLVTHVELALGLNGLDFVQASPASAPLKRVSLPGEVETIRNSSRWMSRTSADIKTW